MIDGLIIAAPSSGNGKTVVTVGLLRALLRRGVAVCGAKVGPDYIDPTFHTFSAKKTALNLDEWAMRPALRAMMLEAVGGESSLMIAEGTMGLYDGIGPLGIGSTADLAMSVGWPVVLVVDARGASTSVAVLLQGFAKFRDQVNLVGVIANRVGSATHAELIRNACHHITPDIKFLGALPRDERLVLPSRYLGLVQAVEHPDLEDFIDDTANAVERGINLDLLLSLATPAKMSQDFMASPPLPPLGQRIAVARDAAFGFAYPFIISSWRAAGAEIAFFSPMMDEAPDPNCDAVYLCGGYPELHISRIAHAHKFRAGMKAAVDRGAFVYGECGGYMVLGQALIDAGGVAHEMLGMLPLISSFADRRLHLGYRRAMAGKSSILGRQGAYFRGHEFHYAGIVQENPDDALFDVNDALGNSIGKSGLIRGRVLGSFIHLIDHETVPTKKFGN
ncbi:MAG: cobyrinate a,c-diamide synthase [Candidatus Symbiobacter sp.]|nr:cobyrinate a,c-diamide synthase [Candidatus Symbiobacter sp.]